MRRARPQLSITLPKNFTFHYTEGEEPKTPEREVPIPAPRSPRAEGAYRIKRRSRPAVTSILQPSSTRAPPVSKDTPIPTIETSTPNEPARPLFQQRATDGYLAPVTTQKFVTLPRTPIAQQRYLAHSWNNQQDVGDSISRPMSACSILSDSSDGSVGSLVSYPAGDGSCTSPESDAPDPFRFASIKKSKAKQWAELARNDEAIQGGLSTKQTRVNWTPDMDKHLWSMYLIYLQDPTVTPFKMLPGTAPPLGVCHRVAREAKRSWHGGRTNSRKVPDRLSPVAAETGRPGSPDTIRGNRSGSNTPTGATGTKAHVWPKSGSSTRRRLRYLCKRKPTIAPHYQRLLQNRSPSPFSSSSYSQSRSQSRLSEASSPFIQPSSSFGTRDIQVSLTTSTAATMQPDGPLAQLARTDESLPQPSREWFNEPPVPFASEPVIPSDVGNHPEIETMQETESSQTPRLGSPFGYHTWGPSRSKQRIRPSTPRIHSSDAPNLTSSLRSPIRLHDTFPYQGINKRRARHQLEAELSPGGSNIQQNLLDNLFGSPPEARHRRVRSRGFSLGDVSTPNPLQTLFTPPSTCDQLTSSEMAAEAAGSGTVELPQTPTTEFRRLGSPFHGVSPRPTRGSSRHMATSSLGSYDISAFSSIGETLCQAPGSEDLPNHLQK